MTDISESDSEDDGMKFFKFRYAFPSGLETTKEQKYEMVTYIRHLCDPLYITVGYETLDKCGQPTNPHMHISICTVNPKKNIGSMRRAFQRSDIYKEAKEKGRYGNVLYSFVQEKDVKDINRFFRYPMKQVEGHLPFRNIYPPDFEVTLEKKMALDEWTRQCEINKKLKARKEMPTGCDKIMEHLETLEPRPTGDINVLAAMIAYYAEKGSAANKQTLLGYLNTYNIRSGIITPEQMAQLWLEK